jgi:hypothetical protein
MAPQQSNEPVARPIGRVASDMSLGSLGSEAYNPVNAKEYKVRKSSLIGYVAGMSSEMGNGCCQSF